MSYRIVLDNGHVHEGFDEREVDDLLAAIAEPDMDGLPDGWTWIAGLHVQADRVIAVGWVAEADR